MTAAEIIAATLRRQADYVIPSPTDEAREIEADLKAGGYVIVPVKPTEAMLAACEAAWRVRVLDKGRARHHR